LLERNAYDAVASEFFFCSSSSIWTDSRADVTAAGAGTATGSVLLLAAVSVGHETGSRKDSEILSNMEPRRPVEARMEEIIWVAVEVARQLNAIIRAQSLAPRGARARCGALLSAKRKADHQPLVRKYSELQL
jgi:hypothetical protein